VWTSTTKLKTIYNIAARRRQLNLKTYWTIQCSRMLKYNIIISRYRTHSETCDQILLSVWRLLSESCCLGSVGRPLWREVGSVICHSQCVVIYKYLHQAFTLQVLYSSAICIQYIQSFIQSRLSTADYASEYRNSMAEVAEGWGPSTVLCWRCERLQLLDHAMVRPLMCLEGRQSRFEAQCTSILRANWGNY
jgi:hypothetical protein